MSESNNAVAVKSLKSRLRGLEQMYSKQSASRPWLKYVLIAAAAICAIPMYKVGSKPVAAAAAYVGVTGPVQIQASQAGAHIGEEVEITFQALSTGHPKNSTRLFFNDTTDYKVSTFTVVVETDKAKAYASTDARTLKGKTITVTGKPSMYNGKPQIVVTDDKQLIVK